MTAGAGAIATKAVAGLAAAAIVTAGAVAVDHGSVARRGARGDGYATVAAVPSAGDTMVVHQQPQPFTASAPQPLRRATLRATSAHRPTSPRRRRQRRPRRLLQRPPPPPPPAAATSPAPGAAVAPASHETTQVTTASTQLPASATAVPGTTHARRPAVTTTAKPRPPRRPAKKLRSPPPRPHSKRADGHAGGPAPPAPPATGPTGTAGDDPSKRSRRPVGRRPPGRTRAPTRARTSSAASAGPGGADFERFGDLGVGARGHRASRFPRRFAGRDVRAAATRCGRASAAGDDRRVGHLVAARACCSGASCPPRGGRSPASGRDSSRM